MRKKVDGTINVIVVMHILNKGSRSSSFNCLRKFPWEEQHQIERTERAHRGKFLGVRELIPT